jgi:Phosphotransferase enzyme family
MNRPLRQAGTVSETAESGVGIRLLTGDDADELLRAAVAAMGGRLEQWTLSQVDHRPATGTTTAYAACVSWPDGNRAETLGAHLAARPQTNSSSGSVPGVVTVSDGEHQVRVWRLPADPALPGLVAACNPDAVAGLLRSFGVDAPSVTLRILGYRPGRRAVVEATTPGARLYVKVMRPSPVEPIHRRHVLLHDAGLPVPRSLGWSDDGLLVLAPLPGIGLREAVHRAGASACPPDQLWDVLEQLPDAVSDLPRRLPWAASAEHFAEVVGDSLPAHRGWARELAASIDTALGDREAGDDPVHGDFYEAQLLVDAGRISGLLDVDTVGPGRRVDDLGCLLGHLSVLATMDGTVGAGVTDALQQWSAWFDRRVDPMELRVVAAGVTLSLATGPFRTQDDDWEMATERRLDLVGHWLEAAQTASLPDLRDLSPSTPRHLMSAGDDRDVRTEQPPVRRRS